MVANSVAHAVLTNDAVKKIRTHDHSLLVHTTLNVDQLHFIAIEFGVRKKYLTSVSCFGKKTVQARGRILGGFNC